MRALWKRWRWRREQRDWEVYLFNHGTVNGWHRTKTINSITRVWDGWPW